jgi:hypothetical protein
VITGWALIAAYLFTGITVLCRFANFAQGLLSLISIIPSPVFLIVYGIAGVMMMLIPLINSIGIPGEASLFPLPPAPFNLFPYWFLLYLAIGARWFTFLQIRSLKVIQEIRDNIEAIHLKFSKMPKI